MKARRCARWVVVRMSPHLRSQTVKVIFNDWAWHVIHRRHRNVPREARTP